MSFTADKNNLMAKLEEVVSDDTNPLKDAVFGRKIAKFAGFPAVRILIDGVQSRHITSHDYQRIWRFRAEILHVVGNDVTQAEIDLGLATEAIIDKLDNNWSLDNTLIEEKSGDTGQEDQGSGKMIILALNINARSLSNNI